MAQIFYDTPYANYGVAYSEAILALAGGYESKDLSSLALNCEPSYGNAEKSKGATTYVDGEKSVAIDREWKPTPEEAAKIEAFKKNPTQANFEAIYNDPVYAYYQRQRTKFTPQTLEVSVMFNDEADFFARTAQRTGDVKTAANTLMHNTNREFVNALRAETVLRQQTDGYGQTTDNDTADTLPDICQTTIATDTYLTVDHLLEIAGKIDEIEGWDGIRLALINTRMKTNFLRNNLDTIANSLFVPNNDVIRARKFEGYAGFAFLTSTYVRPDEILIFEPNKTLGKVHWFDRVKGGSSRGTKWQQELLYQRVLSFKRLDDMRFHYVKFSALQEEGDAYKAGATTGSVIYS